MLWKNTGHDRPLYVINFVLVACSMSLSAYFGYTLGEGVWPLNWVLAALCASVALGVSTMFERGAMFQSHGMRARAINCWIVGLLFAGANIIFDYSSAAALREAVTVAASNANNVADTRKSEVKRIEDRIGEIKRQTAWATTFEAPDSYQAEIDNLNSDGIIVKRSKGCTDQTLPDTRAHCAKIATAKAHLAMAIERQRLSKEMAALDVELSKAKGVSAETKIHSNPAIAQIRAISAWFTGDKHLNENTTFWGSNSVMLLMTVLVNVGLIYIGNELGHSRALTMQPPVHRQEHVEFNAPRLAGPAAPPGTAANPIPLKPVDPATNLVVIGGVAQPNSSQAEQLMAQAMAALKRYEQSPFAQDGGKA